MRKSGRFGRFGHFQLLALGACFFGRFHIEGNRLAGVIQEFRQALNDIDRHMDVDFTGQLNEPRLLAMTAGITLARVATLRRFRSAPP